jgi:hypothetical protein
LATRQIVNLPRTASLRKPDAVMLPSGKAILAATSRRKGKSGAASRGSKAADERIEQPD